MAGRVRQSDIEELKAKLDIVEVVASYVSLKPASAGSFKGLCPFHSEKSPSFNVRSAPAFYHCPLVTDEKGVRLAKRHDAWALRTLREQGKSPADLRADWL